MNITYDTEHQRYMEVEEEIWVEMCGASVQLGGKLLVWCGMCVCECVC